METQKHLSMNGNPETKAPKHEKNPETRAPKHEWNPETRAPKCIVRAPHAAAPPRHPETREETQRQGSVPLPTFDSAPSRSWCPGLWGLGLWCRDYGLVIRVLGGTDRRAPPPRHRLSTQKQGAETLEIWQKPRKKGTQASINPPRGW